eukprot:1154174-Pelagomonas_calceolata.AAC.7
MHTAVAHTHPPPAQLLAHHHSLGSQLEGSEIVNGEELPSCPTRRLGVARHGVCGWIKGADGPCCRLVRGGSGSPRGHDEVDEAGAPKTWGCGVLVHGDGSEGKGRVVAFEDTSDAEGGGI